MKKLMALSRTVRRTLLVAGVAVLCGAMALAQHNPPGGAGPHGGPAALDQTEDLIARAHHAHGLLLRAIREGEHDAATWPLVTTALTDRAIMLQAELTRVSKLQALVTAHQGGDKTAIQTARQDVKTATAAVETAAKAFIADAEAVREHLKSQHGAATGAGATSTPPPSTAK